MPHYLHRTSPFAGGAVSTIPGDKSVSHRALMFGALASGETTVEGLLEGEDIHATQNAFTALGATISGDDGTRVIQGCGGIEHVTKPAAPLDFGNAGTSARLTAGILACCPFTAVMTGDASLCSRPMERVFSPLRETGASFVSLEDDFSTPQEPSRGALPALSYGTSRPVRLRYRLPMPSAQVKSALLLAGIFGGEAEVTEPVPTRDHTEIMLRAFGGAISVTQDALDGSRVITAKKSALNGTHVVVPADPSSAAFPALLHILSKSTAETVLNNVMINPLRSGFFDTLPRLGLDVTYRNRRSAAGEEVADIVLAPVGTLRPLQVFYDEIPSMIHEIPALAAVCSMIPGTSVIRGCDELRVKESDRLEAIIQGLAACGVNAFAQGDDLHIDGAETHSGGGTVNARLDHRIAMTFLLAGLYADAPVIVDDISCIATSFPNFFELLATLGVSCAGI